MKVGGGGGAYQQETKAAVAIVPAPSVLLGGDPTTPPSLPAFLSLLFSLPPLTCSISSPPSFPLHCSLPLPHVLFPSFAPCSSHVPSLLPSLTCLFLPHPQHINGLAKNISVPEVLSKAEVLCRQLGACPNLPEDLQSLVVKPLPRRLEAIAETETIMCSPNSHSVPTGEGKS